MAKTNSKQMTDLLNTLVNGEATENTKLTAIATALGRIADALEAMISTNEEAPGALVRIAAALEDWDPADGESDGESDGDGEGGT